jgi:hypothetical protein
MAHLIPGLHGAIVKLHGDLRSPQGLILTKEQYEAIGTSPQWQYWRTKMTSIFQMNKVVVIGHSLTDPNIRHVLQTAKMGSGVVQPICWIAPDVSLPTAQEYLEKYRIRVISYDNRDGHHSSLTRLIEHISNFVEARLTVSIQAQIAEVAHPKGNGGAAAPGFFVFNKLAGQVDESKRSDIVLAAMQSTLPQLNTGKEVNIGKALALAGWPADVPLPPQLMAEVTAKALAQEILINEGGQLKLGPQATALAEQNKQLFEHTRERFKKSVYLRIKRNYPLPDADAVGMASDIEAALTGYFREGGLTLATTLFASETTMKSRVPTSILNFITEAAAQYDDLLRRQAFCTVSVDCFVSAESAEREYLGRISQGFFAFHALGAFGDAALHRLKHAKETVWLMDSHAQIPALALGAPTHGIFRAGISRVQAAGVRLFTTKALFWETCEHFWFARNVIGEHGATSPYVHAAALGEAPYKKSNQFLEGFIRWQAAGNPCDWDQYVYSVFQSHDPTVTEIEEALRKIGIEVIPFEDWPGYKDQDQSVRNEYISKITDFLEKFSIDFELDPERVSDLYKKAKPEAEALIIILRERSGAFYVLSQPTEQSPAWFISQTSMLNALASSPARVTWQPEAFLRFAATLYPPSTAQSADQAFEILLWKIAESGISVLDPKLANNVFGGIVDSWLVTSEEQEALYSTILAEKYGEPREAVLERLPPARRALAALQIAQEIALRESGQKAVLQETAAKATKRVSELERKLGGLEAFRRKQEKKKKKHQKTSRRHASKSKTQGDKGSKGK